MRDKFAFFIALGACFFSACANSRTRKEGIIDSSFERPLLPIAANSPIPHNANVLLISYEQLPFFALDGASYIKVYIDHHYAGRTNIAAKSSEKKWGAVLEPGKHLFRFEKWNIAPSGNWHVLASPYEPSERWLNLSGSSQTVVTLIFSGGGLKHSLNLKQTP